MAPIFDDITAVCDLRRGTQQGAACCDAMFLSVYIRTPHNSLIFRQKYSPLSGMLRPGRSLRDQVATERGCAGKVAPQNDPGK
jgi:hypothetical protein